MKRTFSFTLAPLILSVAAALLCFVSCDARYPHEPDGGVAIYANVQRVHLSHDRPDTPGDNINRCVL